MKKRSIMLLALFLSIGVICGTAHAGKIVLANDEWTLSNSGYSSVNDPDQFAKNVASWFTGGMGGGNFLAYSNNFGLTGSQLSNTMTGAGHTWTVSTAVTFDLATLSSYDGVFLAGYYVNNQVLIDYVNNGGNIYLAGGTGVGGAAYEAGQWNAFLNTFGLGFGTFYNGVGGNIAISSTHPIFASVDHLYQSNGNDTLDLNAGDLRNQVLISQSGHGLYAVYDSAVPLPPSILLLGTGIIGLVGSRILRKKN